MSHLRIFVDDAGEVSDSSLRVDSATFLQFKRLRATSFLRKVASVGDKLAVHVPKGLGEKLRYHLATYGVQSVAYPIEDTTFDRVEIDGDLFPEDVQEIVDKWGG